MDLGKYLSKPTFSMGQKISDKNSLHIRYPIPPTVFFLSELFFWTQLIPPEGRFYHHSEGCIKFKTVFRMVEFEMAVFSMIINNSLYL